jgi:hypothetical protein
MGVRSMTAHCAIPASPDEVTDGWLTSRLREGGALGRARVKAHTTSLLELQGAAGVVARLELEYDRSEPQAPRSLVAKFASPHAPIRALLHAMGGYAREVEFYRRFGDDPGISTPHCFHGDIDPASGIFVLLLEDLSDSRMSDGMTSSLEDVEVAVRQLAPFHAKWWNHPRLRELEFLRYPGSAADTAFMVQARGALAAALPVAKQRFGSDLPAPLVALCERLLANFGVLTDARQSGIFEGVTLVHGDFHPGQIFYPSERGGRFAVFDWQTASAGSGGDDLARIIVTGLTAEQRAAHDERLIALYHALLLEHGVTGFGIEQCRMAFRLGLLTTVVINVIAGASIAPEFVEEYVGPADVNVVEALFGRLAAAVEAHDVLDAVPA